MAEIIDLQEVIIDYNGKRRGLMIFLIVEQTYLSIPVGNIGLNYLKFWRGPMSEKRIIF